MLQFYYDFLCHFVEKKNFEYIEMDTDSAYFSIAGKNLVSVVKSDKRQEFLKLYKEENNFLPRTCCEEHKKYDKRTPGLFKLEAEGSEMVALCSKTYVLKMKDESIKLSAKGVQNNRLENPMKSMRNVLNEKNVTLCKNKGFRYIDGNMFTYTQEKKAFGFEYWKRKVLYDGISTEPLDLILTPWKTFEGIHFNEKSPLGLESLGHIIYNDILFQNALSLLEYLFYEQDEVRKTEIILQGGLVFESSILKWSENLEEILKKVAILKFKKIVPDQFLGKELFYANKNKILGCGFSKKVHFMFSPNEYTGRNLWGKCLFLLFSEWIEALH